MVALWRPSVVEAQDGIHQRFFATRTEHLGSLATDVPDEGNDSAQQLQDDLRDGHGFSTAGEDSVVPDADKAFGQDVQRKAANELPLGRMFSPPWLGGIRAADAVRITTER